MSATVVAVPPTQRMWGTVIGLRARSRFRRHVGRRIISFNRICHGLWIDAVGRHSARRRHYPAKRRRARSGSLYPEATSDRWRAKSLSI